MIRATLILYAEGTRTNGEGMRAMGSSGLSFCAQRWWHQGGGHFYDAPRPQRQRQLAGRVMDASETVTHVGRFRVKLASRYSR